jgi:hypothetical protein
VLKVDLKNMHFDHHLEKTKFKIAFDLTNNVVYFISNNFLNNLKDILIEKVNLLE